MKRRDRRTGLIEVLFMFAVAVSLPLSVPASASAQEMSPEEHASHHPDKAGASATNMPTVGPPQTATSDSPDSDGGGGMMGGGMGGMMEKMGAPKPTSLYPTLMSMPDISPQQKEEITIQADERIDTSVKLLSTGLQRLADAAENDNYDAMHEATATMHDALARLESGLAARRALAEDQPPQTVAMQWFKNEMNLQTPRGVQPRDRLWGATPFHLFSMLLLIFFALAMIVLYFLKMRRAAALFSRIESQKGSPPPGSAPALAGSPPPAPKS